MGLYDFYSIKKYFIKKSSLRNNDQIFFLLFYQIIFNYKSNLTKKNVKNYYFTFFNQINYSKSTSLRTSFIETISGSGSLFLDLIYLYSVLR